MSNLSLAPRTGRIKVVTSRDRPHAGGYICLHAGSTGMLTTCADREIAIQVRWTPSAGPHLIEILNTPYPTFNHLGAAHFSNDKNYTQFGPKSTASASLTYTTPPDKWGRTAPLRTDTRTGKPVTGPSRAVIWTVLADDTIMPVVEDSGCRYALYPVVWGEDNSIFIVANCESYMAAFRLTAATCSRARLLF
ncbi:hypothetical protein M407DRAFT_244497, partial [Tulasnella calospora MUT 4182]